MRSFFAAALWSGLLLAPLPGDGLPAQVTQGQEIVTLSTRESLHELTLSTQIATSITFPAEITLVTGYGLVLDAARAQELIDSEAVAIATLKDLAPQPVTIVHYAQASRDTLVLRAVRRGTPCYMTVRCGVKIFLFKFTSGEKANIAVVISDKVDNGSAVQVKKEDILKSRTNYSSSELLGILSRAKGRGFLETVNPELYEGWSQRLGLNLTSGDEKLVSTITEIQQWPQKDALVLRCALENRTKKQIRFKPGDVRVRAGDAAYAVQLADSSGVVAPGKITLLDLVLQGNMGGGKEHLSIQNDFRLEVPIDDSPPPPNDLLPPPNPLLPAMEMPNGKLVEPEIMTPPTKGDLPLPLPNFYRGK
jgi:hypothetical protein